MRLVSLEYICEECERVQVIVAHNKGKNEIKFKLIFNFQTEMLEDVKIYKAPRLRELKDVLHRILLQLDWEKYALDTLIRTDSDKLQPMIEELQTYAYYSALEKKVA
jgi:hypothetical protein